MDRQISFRITQSQYDKFSKILELQGLTVTEALRSFVLFVCDSSENKQKNNWILDSDE